MSIPVPSSADRLAAGPAVAPSFTLVPFDPARAPDVEALHADVFGPGRFARAAFRLRENAAPLSDFSFLAIEGGRLIGSVSMSRIAVGGRLGALLGPLAVQPQERERGIGRALLAKAVERAFLGGESYVLLVGDAPYYAPFGFSMCAPGSIEMPGPVDPQRLLIALPPDSSDGPPKGLARGIHYP